MTDHQKRQVKTFSEWLLNIGDGKIVRVYLSSDEATPHGDDGGETDLMYPNEYLNSLNFAGLPPHKLELKVGAPIILLRNLNLTNGICNDFLMVVAVSKGQAEVNATCSYTIDIYKDIMKAQKSQDHKMGRLQDDAKRLCLVDDLKKLKDHIHVKAKELAKSKGKDHYIKSQVNY
nr:DNA helicase [Tanacetum cinerariifolium]